MATTRASDNFSTRVKIYVLKDQCWEDRGTGICYCRPIDEISSKLMFVVIAEGTESVILSSKISHHSIYQREQGTLLIWAESPEGPNICLSFQAEQGRDEAHQWIMEAQRRLTPPPSSPNERDPSPPVQASLPPLSPDNLGSIIRELENVLRNPFARESFTSYLFEQNFFSQIASVYNQVSEPPHLLCLQDLYRIIKCLLSVNDGRILEAVVRDDFILILAGILENDPDLPGMKLGYRRYLEDASRFRQVIEISNSEILRRIHESFRLSYLKETVLSRSLDESLGGRLATLIGRRNRDVINFMVTHNDYLARVFNLLDDDETLVSKKRDVILFTQHLCSLAKGEPPALVATLFRILSQKGLLPIFRFASSDIDVKVRVIGIEIVSTVVDYDPSQVRAIINSHPQGQAFLNQLVEAFLSESSASVINQYADMLRSLLILHGSAVNPGFNNLAGADLTGNRRRDPDLDIFVGIFYERYMPRLISPVLFLNEDMLDPTLKLNKKQEALVLAVCELMITFLRAHVERCRFFLLGSDFLIKAGLLLYTPAGHIKLAVLRLYRAGLCSKDQLFHKFLIKKDIFKKIFELYLSTNNANNLINSACLELFDCVLKVDSPTLVKYFKDTFNQELYDNRHIRIFEEFFRRTPDTAELSGDTILLESPGYPRPRDGQADLEEERYFDADDDEDEESASSGPSDPASPVLPPKRRRSVEEDDEDDAFLILANPSKPLKCVPSFQKKQSPALSSPTPTASSQSSEDSLREEATSPRATRDSSSPQPRLESPDFTESQKVRILHYEEEESKVHIESTPPIDDSDLEDISDDQSKPLKETSEASHPQDKPDSLEEASIVNSKDEGEGSILLNNSESSSNDIGDFPNDSTDLPTDESHRLTSGSKSCHKKRLRSPEGTQSIARQKNMGSESIEVQGHTRSCSPEFSSDKPQPANTPEVS